MLLRCVADYSELCPCMQRGTLTKTTVVLTSQTRNNNFGGYSSCPSTTDNSCSIRVNNLSNKMVFQQLTMPSEGNDWRVTFGDMAHDNSRCQAKSPLALLAPTMCTMVDGRPPSGLWSGAFANLPNGYVIYTATTTFRLIIEVRKYALTSTFHPRLKKTYHTKLQGSQCTSH